jgi:ElaB/YqjD/DUF883 family membrane-anchored ribosome-binding protein
MPDDKSASRPSVELLEYINQRFADLDKRLDQQREALDTRLYAMNEIRETMRDHSSTMATRDQLDELRLRLTESIEQLRERITETRMHVATVSGGVAVIASIATSVAITVISRFL